MTVPATTVAANAKKSVTRWRKLPSTFRFSRFARATCQIATRLIAAPASAVSDNRRRVRRSGGDISRCTASTTISTPSTSSVIAFACAERISARRNPNVMRPSAGRRARRAAQTESASAAASISMCAASERSASESARIPTTTSTDHERDDQRERDRERAHLRIGAHAVVVSVVMRHGRSLPEMDGVVFVEIPAGSRNKYEWDEEAGGIVLDRRLFTSMSYPADYGFVEGTLAEDGDPLDALVLVGEPTFPGCRIRVRTVGVFHMADEKGPDEKVLCVPLNDPSWSSISDIHDVPAQLRNEIEHFFQVYKDLEDEDDGDARVREPRGGAGNHLRRAAAGSASLARVMSGITNADVTRAPLPAGVVRLRSVL